MNKKKILISLLTFTLFISFTIWIGNIFFKNFQIVKIDNEEKFQSIVSQKKEGQLDGSILKYLRSKNIDTKYLSKKDLESIYWVERIKDGGLILLFRHSQREKWNDSVEGFDTFELYNKKNARNESWYRATCLTEKGIEESKLIFEAFKHANIKISEVISSPSCRAIETAKHAFKRIDKTFSGLLHYSAFHPADRGKIGTELRKAVMDLKIENDKNIILSAHNKVISHQNFIDLMEVGEGLKESGFYIIEKKGGQLVVPFKFSEIKKFVILLYRHNFIINENY